VTEPAPRYREHYLYNSMYDEFVQSLNKIGSASLVESVKSMTFHRDQIFKFVQMISTTEISRQYGEEVFTSYNSGKVCFAKVMFVRHLDHGQREVFYCLVDEVI